MVVPNVLLYDRSDDQVKSDPEWCAPLCASACGHLSPVAAAGQENLMVNTMIFAVESLIHGICQTLAGSGA